MRTTDILKVAAREAMTLLMKKTKSGVWSDPATGKLGRVAKKWMGIKEPGKTLTTIRPRSPQ